MRPWVKKVLNDVLQYVELEEILSIMRLESEIKAHLASPQAHPLLHVFELTHNIIANYYHGCTFSATDRSDEEEEVLTALRYVEQFITQVSTHLQCQRLTNLDTRRRMWYRYSRPSSNPLWRWPGAFCYGVKQGLCLLWKASGSHLSWRTFVREKMAYTRWASMANTLICALSWFMTCTSWRESTLTSSFLRA